MRSWCYDINKKRKSEVSDVQSRHEIIRGKRSIVLKRVFLENGSVFETDKIDKFMSKDERSRVKKVNRYVNKAYDHFVKNH